MKNTLNIIIVFITILFTNTLAFAGANTRIGLTNQDVDNSLRGVNVDFDLLIPLYESAEDEAKGNMIYTQVGASGAGVSDSNYLVGVGYRDYLTDNVLFGVNSFVVSDFTDNKFNLGVELSSNNYRLTANQSFSLGDWKYTDIPTPNGVDVYREKISDGFNLRAEGWLNEYPHLSGNIQYLDLDHKDGFAIGLNYMPIPLLSFGADYNINSDKKSEDVTGYIRFTYRFGKSLKDQLNPSNVVNRRNLLGQKYEFANPDRSLFKVKEFVRKINKGKPNNPDDGKPIIEEPDIKEPVITENAFLELAVITNNALVGNYNSVQVRVYKVKGDEIILQDDVIVSFKSNDTVIGVATSKDGIATLEVYSDVAQELPVVSYWDGIISNEVVLTFKEPTAIDVNYCRTDVHEHPLKGEVRLENKNINEFAMIVDAYATGYWGVGEVITIHYYFRPVSTDDPFKTANATRFEFGESGTTSSLISYFSDFASYDGTTGWNSFNLPPLTEQQVNQSLEVALLAMNDYDEGSNKAFINLDALPCKPLE